MEESLVTWGGMTPSLVSYLHSAPDMRHAHGFLPAARDSKITTNTWVVVYG